MDPISLATITTAVSALGLEAAKGLASKAGEDAWVKIKSLFGWKSDPSVDELAPAAARKLQSDEELANRVLKILQESKAGAASQLVGSINARNAVVAETINVAQGGFVQNG